MKCLVCNLEMRGSPSCNLEILSVRYPLLKDWQVFQRIPHESARDSPCHDCGVQDAGYHHPGCDNEECPRCHGQLISCGCFYPFEESDDGPAS
jgi:hypothetical protein